VNNTSNKTGNVCCGTASITQLECVFVALGIQHAKRMHHVM